MAFNMDYKKYKRENGREPDHMYNHEVKRERKWSNRKARKKANKMSRNLSIDWDCAITPPYPKTSGWLSV